MKLVVDTNILFTYFWKSSFSRNLLMSSDLTLFSPEYSLEEINGHKKEIMRKTGISEEEFGKNVEELNEIIEFVPLKEYSSCYKNVDIVPDKDDLDFLALAFKLNVSIWSNDSHFKKQNLIKTYTTSEIVQELEK